MILQISFIPSHWFRWRERKAMFQNWPMRVLHSFWQRLVSGCPGGWWTTCCKKLANGSAAFIFPQSNGCCYRRVMKAIFEKLTNESVVFIFTPSNGCCYRRVMKAMFEKLTNESTAFIFTPSNGCCYRRVMKAMFEKLAHASIMRLNPASMDKLYDLMTMAVKHQVIIFIFTVYIRTASKLKV